jgi:peroxiredoxin
LAKEAAKVQQQAEAYVINPDSRQDTAEVLKRTHLALPLLSDPQYSVAAKFGLPGTGRPMGGLVGFVVIDPKGIVRFQRVDIHFGDHVGQIVAIARTVNGQSN